MSDDASATFVAFAIRPFTFCCEFSLTLMNAVAERLRWDEGRQSIAPTGPSAAIFCCILISSTVSSPLNNYRLGQ